MQTIEGRDGPTFCGMMDGSIQPEYNGTPSVIVLPRIPRIDRPVSIKHFLL